MGSEMCIRDRHHGVLRFLVCQALSSRLLAKLKLKHYSVLIPSAGIKGAGHRPMCDPKDPLRSIVGPTGSDLRKLLTNKQTSSPCCQQVGCQLVTLHSFHCRLGPIPVTPPRRRSVFDRLSVQAPRKHRKRSTSRDLPSASVNMTERGRESPDPDYSPGLGEVLVHEEGVFRNTRSRVAIPYSYEQPSSSTALASSYPRRSL